MTVKELLKRIRNMTPDTEIVIQAYNPLIDSELPQIYSFNPTNIYRYKKPNDTLVIDISGKQQNTSKYSQ